MTTAEREEMEAFHARVLANAERTRRLAEAAQTKLDAGAANRLGIVTEADDPGLAYVIRLGLRDGTQKEADFVTRRRLDVGDSVNLPVDADGASQAGKGYTWRVRAVQGPP